ISLVFILSVARGIVSSLLSLAMHRSIYTMSHTTEYLIGCMFLSGIFALITIFLSAKCIYTMHKLRTLISCRTQFKIVCIMQTISMLYLLLLSFSYLFAVELMSLSLFQLLSCISVSLTNGILIYFVINFSLQIEQTLKAEIIGAQLDRQLRHYDAYQKHVESFRVFKRNYNITTGTVRLKIQAEDYRGAIELLDQADIHMQTLSNTHKEYCNHPLLDAILQDCANSCGAKDIEFTSMIYIPKGILLSDLDYCRIFSNLCANALEACAVIKDNTQKYIHFTSCVCNGYLIITCENPYNGTIRFRDDLPITIKENKEEHGIGLSIVKKLTEDSGGFVSIKTDAGIFKISLHLKIESTL
ncbi:MAG: ATP-binding protein, partial [Oscillospiraceae bacterium]